MEESNETILDNIKNTYTPFLKKLISHLEKAKDNHPKTEKLKYVYNTFLEADSKEKIAVYIVCKDMLDKWYMRYKKRKGQGHDKKSTVNDPQSEDSQSEIAKDNTSASSPAVKSSIERRGGICFQDEIEIESSDSSTSHSMPSGATDANSDKLPMIKIKQEKADPPPKTITPFAKVQPLQGFQSAVPKAVNVQPVAKPAVAQQASAASTEAKEIVFVCASCQFRTTVEADFMKHARTDHRTDLSLWCKKCGRCFSNAGVLVSHIKEDSCEREEMIYRCGVKDCTFETASGQTFVHHLRHCHKGSPFIFCIHCQKIFTLPHCLILHMQNECPFKEKNRRDPSSVKPTPAPTPQPVANASIQPTVRPTVMQQSSSLLPKVTAGSLQPTPSVQAAPKKVSNVLRARGRTRGRISRGSKFSDSSDSEDPDDPSWRPDENTNNQPLRRSARWAKKVSDATDPDFYESEPVSKKAKTAELPGKTFFYCPCCEFSALFKSLLLDHYVTDHKHQKRMACLVCNVKFENKQGFLDHFTMHENDKDKVQPTNEPVSEPAVEAPVEKPALVVVPKEVVTTNSSNTKTPDLTVPTVIPYQTSIQEKLRNENKVKAFEDLKSVDDVEKMKTETKLQHFYKCVVLGCIFTTDDSGFYVKHLTEHHSGKKLHCGYCFNEYNDAKLLADHMLKDHGRRFYQCSLCFYRASSKAHVQIHMKNLHPSEKIQYFKCSQHLPYNYTFDKDVEDPDLTTTYPYACAIGDCTFKTHEPTEFRKHNDLAHRSVSVFFCFYCKVDFISFKRLMSHYNLHGINNYQCTYCVHGSEKKEEILLHLCNCHADKSLKVHVRAAADNQTAKKAEEDVKPDIVSNGERPAIDFESLPEDGSDKKFTYPTEVKRLDKEVFCRLGFCNKQLENLHCYLKHLINDHSTSNFLCPYCSAALDSIADFESHIQCHGPHLFACVMEKCHWFSHCENNVRMHMSSKHKMEGVKVEIVRQNPANNLPVMKILPQNLPELNKVDNLFVCPLCCYKCSAKGHMKNHIYRELVYKRFQCNICKVKLCSRIETKNHFKAMHSHHNIKCSIDANPDIETIVAFLLSDRLQKFISASMQKENFSWKIFSGLPESRCKNCQTHLPTVRELHHHQLSCLSHGYEPYICNHCGAKAVDLLHMKGHTAEHHPGSAVQYSTFPNKLLEEQQGRKLQEVRLAFLRDTALCIINKSLLENPKSVSKHYKCAYCKFVDNFRSNIAKHCLGCHKDKDLKVEKIKQSGPDVSALENKEPLQQQQPPPPPPPPPPAKEEPQPVPEPEATPSPEGYVCVYCMQKTSTLSELQKHVESYHQPSITENVYPYFYCPDPSAEYAMDDTRLYECAYCSVSQENLYHLKRHCNNLHSAAVFQVRGHKSKDGTMLTCKYCECKVVSRELLSKHCRFNHPGKPIKTAADSAIKQAPPPVKRKKAADNGASKRPKITIVVYQCSYCDVEVDTMVKIISHQEINHSEKAVSYTEVYKDINDLPPVSMGTLYYCDICSFASDKELLQNHLRTKHKNCVQCGHCDMYVESVEALFSHSVEQHEDLPVKQISLSECDSLDFSDSKAGSSNSSYMLNKHTKIYPMFPKVILQDCRK